MQLTWKSKFRDRLKFLRCPPKSLSNDDAPAFKRPRVTNDVEISETEMEEYECNVRSLQKEMEKKTESSELCSLMEKTSNSKKVDS